MTEDKCQISHNPYGYTKLMMEQILFLQTWKPFRGSSSWSRQLNLRYFNPIGAHEKWFDWGIAKRYSKQPDAIYYTSSYR